MYYKITIKKFKIEIIMKITAQEKENKIWLKKELIKLDRKRKLKIAGIKCAIINILIEINIEMLTIDNKYFHIVINFY